MTDPEFTAACVQVSATTDMGHNIAMARELCRQAAARGAQLIVLPENVTMMQWGRDNILAAAYREDAHPGLPAFRALARELDAWLVIGSLSIVREGGAANQAPLANRSYLLAPDGRIAARYDKIHMFDVDLPRGESYRESDTFEPGNDAVVADLPWGTLGLSICYDVRFAHLYRDLAHAGADLIAIPSAFTQTTGRAHWHVLIRARAIETGSFVFAPGQVGTHAGDRKTYGHSLIVDPWGEVLAEADDGPGVILAEIDMARVQRARTGIATLRHDRSYAAPAADRPKAGLAR